MLIDTHCHLSDEAYDDERESIIENFKNDNIEFAINVGYSLDNSKKALALSELHEELFCAVGVHPQYCEEFFDSTFLEIEELAKNKRVVAIGEIGLDYHYEPFDKAKQKEVFLRQLEIADKEKIPVIIHQRDATSDMMKLLKDNRNILKNGVLLHCFSESAETAKEYVKMGFFISFAGPITFKNARSLLEAVKEVPEDLLLSETDCPYLTPHPFRGSKNYPKYVDMTVKKLAELKGMDSKILEEKIRKNTLRLFKRIDR